MMKTIAIATNKGGVGKTSTVHNLSHAFNLLGYRTGCGDADPQSNLSLAFGQPKNGKDHIAQAMLGQVPINKLLVTSKPVHLVPASTHMRQHVLSMTGMMARETLLGEALKPLRRMYDYFFLDCPPQLELMTANALVAADVYLIPFEAEYFSFEGVDQILEFAHNIRKQFNKKLQLGGVFFNKYHPNLPGLSKEHYAGELRKSHLRDKVCETYIRTRTSIAECVALGQSVFEYDPRGDSAEDYLNLAKELLARPEFKL